MSPKELVKLFYDSDMANDETVTSRFFHKDCELHWNSSTGFNVLNYNDVEAFFQGVRESFTTLRFQFSHILENGNFVTNRHTLFGKTIEAPDNEVSLAHFIAIWEVKDEKLYRCHEVSQLTDEKAFQVNSYSEIKI